MGRRPPAKAVVACERLRASGNARRRRSRRRLRAGDIEGPLADALRATAATGRDRAFGRSARRRRPGAAGLESVRDRNGAEGHRHLAAPSIVRDRRPRLLRRVLLGGVGLRFRRSGQPRRREQLHGRTRCTNAVMPGWRALSINWGVWSDVGAAVRHGVDAKANQRGVGVIDPARGLLLSSG